MFRMFPLHSTLREKLDRLASLPGGIAFALGVLWISSLPAEAEDDVVIPGIVPQSQVLRLGPAADRDDAGRLWTTGDFVLQAGMHYTFLVASSEFEPNLIILDQNGTLAVRGTRTTMLELLGQDVALAEIVPTTKGIYTVSVSTRQPKMSGAYLFEAWQGRSSKRPMEALAHQRLGN